MVAKKKPSRAKKRAKRPSRQRDRKVGRACQEFEATQAPLEPLPHELHELTAGQYDFALEWLSNGFNGRQAYLKHHPLVTAGAADVEAWRMLGNAKVRAFLRTRLAAAWGPLEMSADESVGRIGAMARANIKLLYDEKGKLKPVQDWPDWMTCAVKEYDGEKVKLVDPLQANVKVLELEGRMKNPEAAAADAYVEALKMTMQEHKEWREKQAAK